MISHELNGEDIIAVPLEVDDRMEVGIVTRRDTHLSRYGKGVRRGYPDSYPVMAMGSKAFVTHLSP